MRFEIRSGGFFMILLGILVLSGAVFMFGLLAGYDVGRQSELATEQVATSYSIPSAPLVAAASATAAPAPAAAPSAVAANESPPGADDDDTTANSGKGPATAAEMGGGEGVANDEAASEDEGAEPASTRREDHQRTASAELNNPDADTDDTGADTEESPPKHHAFNIQIQAAMDLSGANQMIRRLQKIGFPAHLVPTPIDGQTWYKVEVGPYASQEAAAMAQTAMRQKYNNAYSRGGAAGAESSAPPSAADNGSSSGASDNEE